MSRRVGERLHRMKKIPPECAKSGPIPIDAKPIFLYNKKG